MTGTVPGRIVNIFGTPRRSGTHSINTALMSSKDSNRGDEL